MKIRAVILAGLLPLLAVGCFKFIKFEYDIPLREANVRTRGVAPTPLKVAEEAGSTFVVEDGSFRFVWRRDERKFFFTIENKMAQQATILWAKATYVNERGITGVVGHRSGKGGFGVTNATRPTPVAPGASIEEMVFPAKNFQLGFLRPLFKMDRASRKASEERIEQIRGKTVRITLPLETPGALRTYGFTFLVRDIVIREKK